VLVRDDLAVAAEIDWLAEEGRWGAPRALALDPGWTTGWALSDGACGHFSVEQHRGEDEALACWAFYEQVAGLLFLRRPRVLVVEQPKGRWAATEWPNTLRRLAHMAAVMHAVARAEVTATAARKAVIGRAFRRKGEREEDFDATIRAAVLERGFCARNEHEADAAAVLCAWRMRWKGGAL